MAANHQHDFIRTIQQALGKIDSSPLPDLFGFPPTDVDEILNSYQNRARSERQKLLDLFIEQAHPANIAVSQVANPAEAGQLIRELAAANDPEWGDKKSVIAWHHPLIEKLELKEPLASDNVDFFITKGQGHPGEREREQYRTKLIQSYIGITAADFCVAQSATLVMRSHSGQPRAVSLVPFIHAAVIREDQVIENLEELYFRLKWDPKEQEKGLTNCMTFISGPSKTADIEFQMVFGAHGPRQLHVYVVGN